MSEHRKHVTPRTGIPQWGKPMSDEYVDLAPLQFGLLLNLYDQARVKPLDQWERIQCEVCGEFIYRGDRYIKRACTCAGHFWITHTIEWQRCDPSTDGPPLVERLELPRRRRFSTSVWQLVRGVYLNLLYFRWWMQQWKGSH